MQSKKKKDFFPFVSAFFFFLSVKMGLQTQISKQTELKLIFANFYIIKH